jgi:hypothetical protein
MAGKDAHKIPLPHITACGEGFQIRGGFGDARIRVRSTPPGYGGVAAFGEAPTFKPQSVNQTGDKATAEAFRVEFDGMVGEMSRLSSNLPIKNY